jgi:hypothetical protein
VLAELAITVEGFNIRLPTVAGTTVRVAVFEVLPSVAVIVDGSAFVTA